jgi:4-hydroxybenzoate polyprenyltransferase
MMGFLAIYVVGLMGIVCILGLLFYLFLRRTMSTRELALNTALVATFMAGGINLGVSPHPWAGVFCFPGGVLVYWIVRRLDRRRHEVASSGGADGRRDKG